MKEKEYKPDYINPNPTQFDSIPWINTELEAKGIYLKSKIVSQSITWTGDYTIKCWFPPKIIEANVQSSADKSDGKTDFTSTFSIRSYNNAWVFATSESTNLINMTSLVGNATKRYYNWFNLNISNYSGGAKTIYFICYS